MKKCLDLGVGGANRIPDGYKGYGVDIKKQQRDWLKENKEADLALDPIPYKSDMFDVVQAYDFMEHIPMAIYDNGKKRNCMIELFNEIYRVLKDGGLFYMQTPCYPSKMAFQDPTHLSFWTDETIHYFCGDYYSFHDHNNHKSKFVLESNRIENNHLYVYLKAIKPDEPPYEV